MNDRSSANCQEKTTLNLSLTVEEKRFLKVYAAQNGTTVSSLIQDYVETLKSRSDRDESKREVPL